MPTFTGSDLINAYKTKFSATDAQVAKDIGAVRSVINEARIGGQELKLEFKLRLAAKLGYPWAQETLQNLVDG